MGALLSLFGGEPSPNDVPVAKPVIVTEHDRAVLELKTQRDTLRRYIKKCSQVVEHEVVVAKTLLRQGKKDKAKLCLQKKKFQEQLIRRAEDTLSNVEEMVNTLEFTSIEKKVFDSLKVGAQTLKELHKEMSLEAVEEIMLDTQEAIDHQNEIGAMLREKLTDDDEADILKELEELTSTASTEPLNLPNVPKTPIKSTAPASAQAQSSSQQTRQTKSRKLEAAQ